MEPERNGEVTNDTGTPLRSLARASEKERSRARRSVRSERIGPAGSGAARRAMPTRSRLPTWRGSSVGACAQITIITEHAERQERNRHDNTDNRDYDENLDQGERTLPAEDVHRLESMRQ